MSLNTCDSFKFLPGFYHNMCTMSFVTNLVIPNNFMVSNERHIVNVKKKVIQLEKRDFQVITIKMLQRQSYR